MPLIPNSQHRPSLLPQGMPALLAAALIFLLGGMALEFTLYQERLRQEEVQQQRVTSQAGEIRAVLEAELNASLHLTSGLISYIQANHGELDEAEIEPWLSGLVRQGRHIRNIGLAPGNRITYIYPLAGNEGALGLYYPDNAAQWPAVEQTIRERRPVLAGPVKLKQGGSGLIYRVPVFLDDDSYWGIISTVIDGDSLLDIATRMAGERHLTITLARTGDTLTPQNFLLGDAHSLADAKVRLDVTIPGTDWLLGAASPQAQGDIAHHTWIRIAGWLLSLTLAGLVLLLLRAAANRATMLQNLAASQQRFTRAFDTAPQGMALLDIAGNWLDANDALCNLLGYSRDELRRQRLASNTHPDDVQRDSEHIIALLDKHSRSEQWEKRFVAKSGESIDSLFSVALVDNTPPYLIAQVQDMREYKRLERMKGEFVSTVSHELRTPLTSITGALGMITANALGEVPDKMKSMLEVAHRNSLRLTQLINDLLDMEKLVAGKLAFDLCDQALQPLVEDALANSQAYAAQFNVQFRLTETCSAHVYVDGLRLQQVLTNLLSNAAKFSPSGSTVDVAIQQIGQRIRVSVRDHGPGIPDEFRKRIFEKFSQADSSDRRTKGGTGLGLAISRQLMERMHGTIGYDSTPGQGSTFWFELPGAAAG